MPEPVSTSHALRATSQQATHTLNGTERYAYDPSGRRVWKQEPSHTLVYLYGVDGNLLMTCGDGNDYDYNVYFGGKLIWAEASQGLAAGPLATDRLGSAALRNGVSNKYFPYGEEPATTTQDRTKFATYYRDQVTALDYAQNRYYARTIGRLTTTDPSESWGPSDPQSFNLYSYVQSDPVNFNDATGLGPVTLPPVELGDANCSTAFIYYAAQFGMTIQQFFDSNMGILGMMSFFEQMGSGSSADQYLWAALDWTFANRWDLSASDKAWFYGPTNIPTSFAASVTTGNGRSQVFTSSGNLKTGFAADLLDILTGSPDSGLCQGLETAFEIATGVVYTHDGILFPGMLYVPNIVPGALAFGSNGAVPSHGPFVTQTTLATMLDRGNTWTFYGYQYNPPAPKRPLPPRSPLPLPPTRRVPPGGTEAIMRILPRGLPVPCLCGWCLLVTAACSSAQSRKPDEPRQQAVVQEVEEARNMAQREQVPHVQRSNGSGSESGLSRPRQTRTGSDTGGCPKPVALDLFRHQIAYQRTEDSDPLRGLQELHADVWERAPLTGFYIRDKLNGFLPSIRDTYLFDEDVLRGGGTCPVEENWRECLERHARLADVEYISEVVRTCTMTLDMRTIPAWGPSPDDQTKRRIADELRNEIEARWRGVQEIVIRNFNLKDNQITVYLKMPDGDYYLGYGFRATREPHCEGQHLFGQAPVSSIRRWIFERPYRLK